MNVPTGKSYKILCDRMYNPVTRKVCSGVLEIAEGRFGALHEKTLDSASPTDGEEDGTVDLRGHTILPSLVDAHVHLSLDPWPLDPKARAKTPDQIDDLQRDAAQERLKETFLSGVGCVRDLGDPHGINLAAASTSTDATDLSRVVTSGPGLHRKGRYGRFIGRAFQDRQELLQGVRDGLATPGVQLLKLIVTGIINFKKGAVTVAPQFELDELKAAVDLAHSLGKQVAAHASGEDGVRLAVEAGVDFVEHAYFISKETMEQLAARNLCWTPTFIPVHAQWYHASVCGWDTEVAGHLRRILDEHAKMLRFAHELGVRILPGSDAGGSGVAHGGGLWDELRLMNDAGLSVADVLEAATTKATAWVHAESEKAPYAMGSPADFIVVDGDVHRDLDAIVDIRWVARDGCLQKARRPRLITDAEAVGYGLAAAGDLRVVGSSAS